MRIALEDFGRASGLYDRISVTSVATAIRDKPFALQIEKAGAFYYLDELGFGVGQILPIIADISFASSSHAFLIQQPELHLHPRAQAALGDVFFQAVKVGGAFVIETHSDFIIDRFRLKFKEHACESQAQIIYFEHGVDRNKAYEIEIKGDGSLGGTPEGYRSFFVNESIEKFENL
jgi:predicted ATPase